MKTDGYRNIKTKWKVTESVTWSEKETMQINTWRLV